MDSNLLESLLDLEEDFYKEGFNLGTADGAETGYTEGSVFAVEKGFEKFIELGKLYGKALVWAQRLADMEQHTNETSPNLESPVELQRDESSVMPSVCAEMAHFPHSSRLARNLDTLLELVDPASLPMRNTEEAVSDVDERLKGALTKAKLVQRAFGEREDVPDIYPDAKGGQAFGDGTGSIEDISSLNIRH
ncbi:hypothetical protein BDW74DRAFT_151827 [Aspergillus multicolor]|uniref:Yae1 family protein n=1 Tax=Aspergillus multicolor TaxID=41759 RepID=UPI003CCD16AD